MVPSIAASAARAGIAATTTHATARNLERTDRLLKNMSDSPYWQRAWDYRELVSAILNRRVPANKTRWVQIFTCVGTVLPKKQGSSAARNCQAIFFLKHPKSLYFISRHRVPSASFEAVCYSLVLSSEQKTEAKSAKSFGIGILGGNTAKIRELETREAAFLLGFLQVESLKPTPDWDRLG
jgi:hypothetical protein